MVSSGAVVAAILSVLVLAFVVYLVGEFVTFARTPELRITDPAGDVAAYASLEYTIRGVTEPNSTITTEGLRQNPTATADAQGAFSVTVQLVPGANVDHAHRQRPADRPRQRRRAAHDHGGAVGRSSAARAGGREAAKIGERGASRRARWPIRRSMW